MEYNPDSGLKLKEKHKYHKTHCCMPRIIT